jgi:hypothetical protein
MALSDISPRHADPPMARSIELICFALVFAHAIYLLASYFLGIWLVQPDGTGRPADFVNVWAAGRLVLDGNAAAAYDWDIHKAMEEVAIGRRFEGYFGWHYPPPFLFVAAALASFPYAPAFAGWVFLTFPAYLAAVRGIVGRRIGYLLAAAFPAVLSNFVVGQNGFLTAGLMGGTLLLMQRRPVLAGCLLGLMTYKPHLGLLFPIALAAAGYWRVFFTAAVVATLMAGLSWLAFDGVWEAFFYSIAHTSQAFLTEGSADWSKLQTTFGLARMLGASESLAWSLQICVGLPTAVAIVMMWRRPFPFELKAAALATGTMLTTPYLYTYDLVVLAVPLAFLFRMGSMSRFLPYEMASIGFACLLILAFPFVKVPVGFAAVLVVAALIARRAMREHPDTLR